MHELDLHEHTVDEAMRRFVEFYNQRFHAGSKATIRVVHGYGSTGAGGAIRRKLRAFLADSGTCLEWKTGEDTESNPGVTLIYPHLALPSTESQFAAEILTFCSMPKTELKIAGEFRKHGQRAVKAAIRSLVRQGKLKATVKGAHLTYTAVSA